MMGLLVKEIKEWGIYLIIRRTWSMENEKNKRKNKWELLVLYGKVYDRKWYNKRRLNVNDKLKIKKIIRLER